MIMAVACGVAAPAAEGAASGIFLVAARTIRDPNFSRSVILVTQPPSGGPVGVIINRPLDRRLSELFPEYETLKSNEDVVYFGGPVAREGLVFVVRSAKPLARGMHVLGDVYLTGDPQTVETLLTRSDPTKGLRAFSGYSGWGSRQLKNEIDRGDWYLLPADAETIFEKRPDRIWPELIRRATLRRAGLECSFCGFALDARWRSGTP